MLESAAGCSRVAGDAWPAGLLESELEAGFHNIQKAKTRSGTAAANGSRAPSVVVSGLRFMEEASSVVF